MLEVASEKILFPLAVEVCEHCAKIHNLLEQHCGPLIQEKMTLRGLLKTNLSEMLRDDMKAAMCDGLVKECVAGFDRACTIYWKKDQWLTAINGAEVFVGTTIEFTDIPRLPEWWIWDDISVGVHPQNNVDMEFAYKHRVHSILFMPISKNEAAIMAFIVDKEDPDITLIGYWPIEHGKLHAEYTIEQWWICNLIAARRFLQLPFIQKISLHTPEQSRRQFKAKKQLLPEIKVIILRRILQQYNGKASSSHTRDSLVEWSCQWLVSGHWRNQWYPHLEKHKPIWIDSYMKGPPDKDVRLPVARIAKVIR